MTRYFCDVCMSELDAEAFVVGTARRAAGLGTGGYDVTRDQKFSPTSGYELCESCAKGILRFLKLP